MHLLVDEIKEKGKKICYLLGKSYSNGMLTKTASDVVPCAVCELVKQTHIQHRELAVTNTNVTSQPFFLKNKKN